MGNRTCILILLLASMLGTTIHAKQIAVENTNSSGPGSLLAAIQEANSTSGNDTIIFNLQNAQPGDSGHVIALDAALPDITGDLHINGFPQNGTAPITLSGDSVQENFAIAIGMPKKSKTELSSVIIEGLQFYNFISAIEIKSKVIGLQIHKCRFLDIDSIAILSQADDDLALFLIDSCYFQNAGKTAITIKKATNPNIRHNTFASNNISISILESEKTRIENNTFINNNSGIIVDEKCDTGWVNNNMFNTTANSSISVNNSAVFTISGNTIANNLCPSGDILDAAISIQNTEGILITNNEIHSSMHGIALGEKCEYGQILNNTLDSMSGAAITLEDAEKFDVNENTITNSFEQNGQAEAVAIQISGSEQVGLVSNTINKATNGIIMDGKTGDAQIQANQIQGISNLGIWLDFTEDIAINQNSITNPQTGSIGFGNTAIKILDSENTTIGQNTIANWDQGIVADEKCENAWIQDNLLDSIPGPAISLRQTEKYTVADNTIRNWFNHGADSSNVAVKILSSEDAHVTNNNIKHSNLGIFADKGCEGSQFLNNLLDSIAGTAITVMNSIEFGINENSITNNLGHGIYLMAVSATNIQNNRIGTDTLATPLGNTGNGISINGASADILMQGNTIAQSGMAGIYVDVLQDGQGVDIIGNYIGIHPNLVDTLPNARSGIELDTAWNSHVYQNTIAYNGEFGIKLNHGDGNTFSQNRIYLNREKKPIFIYGASDTQMQTWPNHSILTPSVAAVEYNGAQCAVVVKAESSYAKVELFQGDSGTLHAFRFITDTFVNGQNGFWRGVFDWDKPDNFEFRATVTDHNGSTSEIGWSCYIVTDTLDARAGSFREAILCANYDTKNNEIVFDMPDHTERAIRPWTQLPSIEHPITVAPDTADSIVFSGIHGTEYSGLVFAGCDTFGKTLLADFTIKQFKNGIQVDGCNSLHIHNLLVEGNSANGLFVASDIDSLCVKNSLLRSNDSCGISIRAGNSAFIGISENQVYNNAGDGLFYASFCGNGAITDNTIRTNAQNGIHTREGRLNCLARNNIYNDTLSGIKSNGTWIDSIAQNRIGVAPDSLMPNLHGMEIINSQVGVVTNNEILGSKQNGILISGSNTQISNNYIGLFRNLAPGGNNLNGISGIHASNLVISNNYISNNYGHGILGCDSSSITNNTIGEVFADSLCSFGNWGAGIRGALHSTISQNLFAGNHNGGLVLDTVCPYNGPGKQTLVRENQFTGHPGTAIKVWGATNAILENNQVRKSDTGIVIGREAHAISISNNLIDSIRGAAIFGSNSENVDIGGNRITNCLSDAIGLEDISSGSISNNLIGTDSAGRSLPNTGDGISLLGTASGIHVNGNTIVASGNNGIYVNLSSDTCHLQIQGNCIGIHMGLGNAMKNRAHGIGLDTAWNVTASKNTIAFNGGSGIDLNHGWGNTFSQNRIYYNGLKPISITGEQDTWPNNTILTPSIAHVELSGGKCVVVAKSEPEYAKIELFLGSGSTINAFRFVTDLFTKLGNGFWETTFDWDRPDSLDFNVSATSADGNTSELGQSCLIVDNNKDGGTGSLRDAIQCANYHPNVSGIQLDLTYSADKTIKPQTQLPGVVYPIVFEADMSDSITVSGANNPNIDGLVFSGNATGKKTELSGFIIGEFKNGIHIDGSHSARIENLIIRNNSENGIAASTDIDSLWLAGSRIYSNDSCGISVRQANAAFIEISNNQINNNAQSGISYKANCANSAIRDNSIRSNAAHGICTKNGNIAKIQHNQVFGNSATGINIQASQFDSISDNQIGTNPYAEAAPNNHGMEISGNSNGLVFNNQIAGNLASGMLLSSRNTAIRNNFIGMLDDFTPMSNGSHGISGENASNLVVENNYIGNNLGDGILGCNSSAIRHNKIGAVDSTDVGGNQGAGLRGSTYSAIYKNVFVGNAQGGLVLDTDANKISECLFYGNQPVAIDLPQGAKAPASFRDYATYKDYLELNGTSQIGDSVEIFFSTGVDQTALRFVGKAKTKPDGTWAYNVPYGPNYNLSGANYYANTATGQNGKTSELSKVFNTMETLCSMDHYLPENSRGEWPVCLGGYKRVVGKDPHYSYTWVHQYAPSQDSVYSRSRITEFYDKGLYILTVSDPTGCEAIDSLYLEVHNEALQTDFLMSTEAGIKDKIVLVETSFPKPDSVVWDFDGAETGTVDGNPTICFYDTGVYEIELKAYLGSCSGTTTKTIHIGEGSRAYKDGFVYPYKIINAKAYPLPAENQLTVSVSLSEETGLNIMLFDNNGNQLSETRIDNAADGFEHKMDLTGLDNGIYYISVSDNGNEKRVIKIIK